MTVCPRCGTLYHDGCWEGPSSCVTPACQEAARELQAEAAHGPLVRPEHPGTDRRAGLAARGGLPTRVKAGEFTPTSLAMETSTGRVVIPWQQVELITLGVIEEGLGEKTSRSGVRNMVRKLLFGESSQEQQQKPRIRETWLLDVYTVDNPSAYRFDSGMVNYRSFLGQVSYSSAQNFLRLAARLVSSASDSRLDASVMALLSGQRDRIRRYGAVYDYELESAQQRARLAEQKPRGDFEVPAGLLEPLTEGEPVTEQ